MRLFYLQLMTGNTITEKICLRSVLPVNLRATTSLQVRFPSWMYVRNLKCIPLLSFIYILLQIIILSLYERDDIFGILSLKRASLATIFHMIMLISKTIYIVLLQIYDA
jgi:hypothetical protein